MEKGLQPCATVYASCNILQPTSFVSLHPKSKSVRGCWGVCVGVGNAQSFSAHSSKQRAARFDANRKREAAAPIQQMGATLNN